MSEANSIASMVTYSLKSLFNPGQEAVHPSRQDIGDSDPFAKTLADASPATREVPPTITADSEDGLPVP
ncbi:MAG TPA: hypothetical protein HPQ00_17025, partial [Magnetococcales bacterium]|nr:hypothetical protein [Magnetococcales bacterium]